MATISQLDRMLLRVTELNGTDLILTVGAQPMMRVDGDLLPVKEDAARLDADEIAKILDALLLGIGQEKFGEHERERDFSFSWQEHSRIRGNAYRSRGSVAVALRLIPNAIPSFDWLGLPDAVRDWAKLRRGLVFVTGPTGGGKSTTLASLIDYVARNRRCHVITIEDPIEYLHDHGLSAVDQREVGTDTASFSDALRSALREDPDVLLVGEMRDLESIRFALTIAETGHLVFATLHTNDVAQALDRIVDVFPSDQQPQIRVQLANTLTGICYQRLLPRLGGGLVAGYEVLVATNAVRNLIREGKSNQLRNQLLTGQSDGMQTLEAGLSQLVLDGVVDRDEAVRASLYPKEIAQPRPEPVVAAVAANG